MPEAGSGVARGGLGDEPYSWQRRGDGSVAIHWRGQAAATLRGAAADRLVSQLERCDGAAQQRALARATGQFKRGNERR